MENSPKTPNNEIKMANDLVTTHQICVGETKNLHSRTTNN